MTFQRFLELCVGRTAQLLNFSSLAGDCGISQPTAKAWLGILEASFLVFRLPALRKNLRQRLVKASKLHFYDTGLVCWLLGIRSADQLRAHPLRERVFGTWVVSEIAKHRINRGERAGMFYYRDRNGAEAGLVIESPSRKTIADTRSSRTASSNLFDNARRIQGYLAESGSACDVVAVHGGDESLHRADGRLLSWRKLEEFDRMNTS